RSVRRDAEPLPLPDRVVDDPIVPAEHAAIEMHNLAVRERLGMHAADHIGILPLRYETDVLAVVLVGNLQPKLARQLAHRGLAHAAERKAQEVDLLLRRGKQEIALVARRVDRPVEPAPAILEP